MAALDDLGTALTTAGLVDGVSGWKLYLGFINDTPDKAVCIYELPGGAPEQAWSIDRPGFQIRVRGEADGYQAARAKWQAIFELLHDGDASVGASWVYLYATHSGPMSLGQDEKRRPHLGLRLAAMRNRP